MTKIKKSEKPPLDPKHVDTTETAGRSTIDISMPSTTFMDGPVMQGCRAETGASFCWRSYASADKLVLEDTCLIC